MEKTKAARAVQMGRYGAPDVLKCMAVKLAALGPDEVRIRTRFAAVNHTDLEIRRGAWPIKKAQPFPHVPGVEVVGEVDAVGARVQAWSPGQQVITMMQGLGGVRAERPGGYADFVTVDAATLAAIPEGIEPASMAALGLAGVTAFEGLRRAGELAGKRVLVTGAAGGVGSAACAIAAAQRAEVIGLVSREGQAAYVRSLGACEVLVAGRNEAAEISAESVDVVLDTVAGRGFATCVAGLRPNGVLCLVGAVGGAEVCFDAWELIRPVTLTGYSSEALTGAELRLAVDGLSDLLRSHRIRTPKYVVFPLARAADAHRRLEAGGFTGRVLLQP